MIILFTDSTIGPLPNLHRPLTRNLKLYVNVPKIGLDLFAGAKNDFFAGAKCDMVYIPVRERFYLLKDKDVVPKMWYVPDK